MSLLVGPAQATDSADPRRQAIQPAARVRKSIRTLTGAAPRWNCGDGQHSHVGQISVRIPVHQWWRDDDGSWRVLVQMDIGASP